MFIFDYGTQYIQSAFIGRNNIRQRHKCYYL